MKRDWKLIRSILIGLETYATAETDPIVNRHFQLLEDRGWIDNNHLRGPAGRFAQLTYSGHEAAELLRNEVHFNAALAELDRTGIGPSEETLFKLIRLQQEATLLLQPAFPSKPKPRRTFEPGDKVSSNNGRHSIHPGYIIRVDYEANRATVAWLNRNASSDAPPHEQLTIIEIPFTDIGTKRPEPARSDFLATLRILLDSNGTPHDLPPP